MHVKVSGSYNLVTGIWSKISGTWTAMKAAFVKTTAVTFGANSYPWAVNYMKHQSSGTYTVTGEISFGWYYGLLNSARWYLKAGTYKGKAALTLNSGPYNWFIASFANGSTYKCAYDGQTVSYPFTGHYHYSSGSQTITIPEQTLTANGNEYALYIRVESGATNTMTLFSNEIFKVS